MFKAHNFAKNKFLLQTVKYSEDELVFLLKQKDQQAFLYLYDNYSPALNGTITKIIDDVHLSEDILQEAFVKIWNNIEQYDASKGRLFTWMINLTRNLTIDKLRSKGYKNQQKIFSNENFVSSFNDNTFSTSKFDTIGLRQTVSNLKPDQKLIINLAYFNGYTQEEISQEMNIPLGTVKSRMRAAIIELRKLLRFQTK